MSQDYTRTFTVEQSPAEVFAAINNPRGWWSREIDGRTNALDEMFYYHYQDVHRCTFKITEFIPNQRVVWHVLSNYFNFVDDASEWIDTDVVFEIMEKDDQTELTFTHVGLVPTDACYDICHDAWTRYIMSSLFNLITTGEGEPNPIEEVVNRARQMQGSS